MIYASHIEWQAKQLHAPPLDGSSVYPSDAFNPKVGLIARQWSEPLSTSQANTVNPSRLYVDFDPCRVTCDAVDLAVVGCMERNFARMDLAWLNPWVAVGDGNHGNNPKQIQ